MKELRLEKMRELPYAMEEAVNRLRINIGFLGKDVRKIMVVSAMPNEGKSLVCAHLWRQMANSGIKSVLVDCDMRNSALVGHYGIRVSSGNPSDKNYGTSNYLSSEDPLDQVVYHTQYPDGDFIPNFDNVVNPSLLLEGSRFSQMLDSLAKDYRYVFVDSPPLNLVSDSETIGHYCDGAIIVVRAGETSKKLVTNTINQLERAGCPILGLVLNRVKGTQGGYYSKRYGSYYGKNSGYYYGK